jgi:hypothetical protein
MEIRSPYAAYIDLIRKYCEEGGIPIDTLIPNRKRFFDRGLLRTMVYTTADKGEQALLQILMQLGDEKCQPGLAHDIYDILEPHLNEVVKLAPPRKTADGTPTAYHRRVRSKRVPNLSRYQQPLL